jgi:molecular chaperone DnaK
MKLGEALYKAQADAAAGDAESSADGSDEKIVDADFEEVKDDKKD